MEEWVTNWFSIAVCVLRIWRLPQSLRLFLSNGLISALKGMHALFLARLPSLSCTFKRPPKSCLLSYGGPICGRAQKWSCHLGLEGDFVHLLEKGGMILCAWRRYMRVLGGRWRASRSGIKRKQGKMLVFGEEYSSTYGEGGRCLPGRGTCSRNI